MKIYSIYDPEFADYGKVRDGYDVQPILDALNASTPLPENVKYVPEEPAIQSLPAAEELGVSLYGGLPVQFGFCNGHNTKLNCLEYHRDSEFNLGTEDFILILAKEGEIKDGKLDTSLCKAFRVPAGVLVEVYATSLHYAPCHTDPEKGFRVLVALPKGTNYEMPAHAGKATEDKLLWASNKWLLAHPDTSEAAAGAWVGLVGENLDIAGDI
jgi:hypothetical protein